MYIFSSYFLHSLAGKLKYTRKITFRSQIEIWESKRYIFRLNYTQLYDAQFLSEPWALSRLLAYTVSLVIIDDIECFSSCCSDVAVACKYVYRCCHFQWNFELEFFHSVSFSIKIFLKQNIRNEWLLLLLLFGITSIQHHRLYYRGFIYKQ